MDVETRISEVKIRFAGERGWTESTEDYNAVIVAKTNPKDDPLADWGPPPHLWEWVSTFRVDYSLTFTLEEMENILRNKLTTQIIFSDPHFHVRNPDWPRATPTRDDGELFHRYTEGAYARKYKYLSAIQEVERTTGILEMSGCTPAAIFNQPTGAWQRAGYAKSRPAAERIVEMVQTGVAEFGKVIGVADKIPDFSDRRFEHCHIVSPPGTGKSNLLANLIAADLVKVHRGEASVIVMESNRDLIRGIEGLVEFGPGGHLEGKLLVIDVEDVEWPVALNVCDIGLSDLVGASALQREMLHTSAVTLLDYIFSFLQTDLTGMQKTLFHFTISLLLEIPGATLDTVIELLQKNGVEPYRKYLKNTDRDTQQFFATKFNSQEFAKTKGEVENRIYAVKRNRAISRIFSSKKTKLDLYAEMGKGKVILINAAKGVLGEQGVEMFGRFWLALILMAAQKRALIDQDDRLATYVYIDEAQDIIRRDTTFPVILDQARKFRVAMTIAHQRLDQMEPPVLAVLMSSTSIKFASNLSDANASALARNMNTTAEFIANQKRFHHALFVRGKTKTAVSVTYPELDLMKLQRMKPQDSAKVREEVRAKYCTHVSLLNQVEHVQEPEQKPEPMRKARPKQDEDSEWA